MRRSLRSLLVPSLVLVILAVLLYRSRGMIQLEGFSWDRLAESVREARGSLLLLSLIAIMGGYTLRALRWVRFSRYLGRSDFGNVFSSTIVGFTAVFLLGRAGEPIRPLLIARKDRVPVSSTFGIYVLERVFDTASTAVIIGLSLLLFPHLVAPDQTSSSIVAWVRTGGLVLLVGLAAAVAFLLYFRWHGAGLLERYLAAWRTARGWKRSVAGFFGGFSEGLQAIRTFSDLVAATAYSVAHWLAVALVYLWVPHSFGGRLGQIDFPGALVVMAFTMIGSTLQLPVVGVGSQFASFLAFTLLFGVEKEPATVASVVLWLVTFAACSLVGVPLLVREGWSMGELRQLARAEAEAEAGGTHVSLPDAPPAPARNAAKPGDPRR